MDMMMDKIMMTGVADTVSINVTIVPQTVLNMVILVVVTVVKEQQVVQ
jgi:hypothetical protein